MILSVKMQELVYDVIIEKNSLNNVSKYFDLNHKVLIVTDSGIPTFYVETLKKQINDCYLYVIQEGESSKSFENYGKILDYLVEKEFKRTDVIIALGGGVCGDLAGFVASTYMRGITFYNIPTTLLSQVDSSIGGKCAIDKNGIKNVVGAFYPPKKVLIDSTVLKTLDERQLMSGLVEAIKMGVTNNKKLFELIKKSTDLNSDLDEIIIEALSTKKMIVESDPKEENLRKVLNFGHTFGHAIESSSDLYHGEAVGIGMLIVSENTVKEEIKRVLEKYHLPTTYNTNYEDLVKYIKLDKKRSNDYLTLVISDEIGTFKFEKINIEELKKYFN